MGRLDGKVAIVSGAAMGMGEADARLFAKEGAKVVVADIDESKGREVAEGIRNDGGNAIFVRLDVRREEDWESLMAEVIRAYGKVNIVVNNAGVITCKSLEETSLDDWNRIFDVNSTGVFLGTKHAIQHMKRSTEPCSIINRSSIAAMVAVEGMEAYCASKGSVRAFTKAAALTCATAGYNIRVNSVHPGEVTTPMMEQEAREYGLPLEEYRNQTAASHPMGFNGEPIDVAYLDLYLASDESRWVTGSECVIDGGWLIK